jgi:hypothetical protein
MLGSESTIMDSPAASADPVARRRGHGNRRRRVGDPHQPAPDALISCPNYLSLSDGHLYRFNLQVEAVRGREPCGKETSPCAAQLFFRRNRESWSSGAVSRPLANTVESKDEASNNTYRFRE